MPTRQDVTPPLTVKRIESLRPREERYEVGDAAAPGLRLRVMPSGLRIFRWYRHAPGGGRDVVTIRPWSPVSRPGHVTLHEARARLDALKAAHRGGEVATVEAEIKKSEALAKKMGVNGTPHFLVGDRAIPGAPEDLFDQLEKHVSELRKSGCSYC